MHVMSPDDRAIAWRTADAHRGEEREALLHLLTEGMLVELRSDLDLYGEYEAAFLESVDLLDKHERFFDHTMLMTYQALGIEGADGEGEGEHEDSRRLVALVASRLGDVASSEGDIAPDERRRAGQLGDLWREHLAGGEAEQYVTVAQVAARHGVTPQAVYRWIHGGKIEAEERPGGSYRIPTAQFRASRSLHEGRRATRRKLADLQGRAPMTDDEIVAELHNSRRED